MSKRQLKSQASAARAATAAFGSGFGASPAVFGASSSPLAYVTEPPDLSAISDPNVVVYFRNLSKRDSTTKAKALEELQSYVASLQAPVEDGVLEAWIKMYPRTSIDNAKAVRQNAHALMGQIAASAGKRIAKYMPRAVGAWLCGLYDADRSVAEATQNSLRLVFNTAEKIQSIRRAYQQPILEFCRDAIDKETSLTLSDERTVSPDDATAKYSRVIAACISLVGSLLSNLGPEDLSKYKDEYDSLLADKKVWEFASHSDPPIRRAVHRFLKTCVEKQPESLGENLELISKTYLAGALNSDQVGSAFDYLEALRLFTSKYPTVWTEHYKSKTAVDRRLRQFLKKGSQFGPRTYWALLEELFKLLPQEVLPKTGADAAELLGALHGGIIRKDESKLSLGSALETYLYIANLLSQGVSEDERPTMLKELVLPLVSQYLHPTPANSEWAVPNNSVKLVSQAITVTGMPAVVQEEWRQYTQALVDEIKTLAPEQSQEYKTSQNALIKKASRFASLQKQVVIDEPTPAMRATIAQACASIIKAAIGVVTNRNGKPYGAAAAIAELLAKNKKPILENQELELQLEQFIRADLPKLILSPSCSQLVDILYSMADNECFTGAWVKTLNAALTAEDSAAKASAVDALLTSSSIPEWMDVTSENPELIKYLQSRVQAALEGTAEWDSFGRLLTSGSQIIPPTATDEILSTMTQALSINEQAPNALDGFRQLVKQNPSMLRFYLSSSGGASLLQGLLLASESPNEELAQEAVAINASIQTLMTAESSSKKSIFDVIRHGLREATASSVSVETLVDLAKQLAGSDPNSELLTNVFPSLVDWDEALAPFLNTPPRSSLAITSPLSGAVYLVQSDGQQSRNERQPRDANGYSAAYRTAQYAVKLLQNPDLFSLDKLPAEMQTHILSNISLTALLAGDNLGLAGANNLWAEYNSAVEAEAMAFITDAHEVVTRDRQLTEKSGAESVVSEWVAALSQKSEVDTSSRAYYEAAVQSVAVSEWIELHGSRDLGKVSAAEIQELVKALRKSKDILSLLAVLHAFREPLAAAKSSERMCNELVADLTGVRIESRHEEGLRQLLLLNAILYGQEGMTESIAKQRVIFFVKHVVPWLHDADILLAVRAETCRALTALLPMMSDIYGEHWGEILGALAKSWQKTGELEESGKGTESPMPYTHASLKLYAQLRTLTQSEDPNDDLLDAWKESEQNIARGLMNLLNHSQHFPDEFHQPLRIVNELLARQISKVSLKHFESTEDLFPLLYVESQPVQQTAFDILHKQIPAAQEQISIDAALEKTKARLPEELLSLILEAPTVAALGDASFERSMPLPLRGYLLSWLLVFDHLEHASFKVKNDYVDHIKEGDYLPGLLSFTFDFLGHSRNKPVDVSKLDITTYTPDIEPPLRDTQWLLTHLYFLCLRHIPSLTRSWWIDCKSRPVVVSLEAWTQKYVSPPVIKAALDSVSTWAKEQSEAEPDSFYTVRVNPRASEITALYTIDEATMSIRITLPPAFPLTSPSIEGVHRVAVNEQKWQAWMRASRGSITLFNSSLVDALMVFRRNVEGAMKGQVECAICYSVVGPERMVPDKRCGTCRNGFHKGCLFRWFRSSGGSSCPLCREAFNYG